MKKVTLIIVIIAVLLLVILAGVLAYFKFFVTPADYGEMAYDGKQYTVDLCGQESDYVNPQTSYDAGSEVRLVLAVFAADLDYSFYLDGEYISASFSESEGYVITFTMPEKDVTLKYVTTGNTTYSDDAAIPDEPDVVIFDYYEKTVGTAGSEPYYEMVLYTYSEEEVRLTCYTFDGASPETEVSYIIPLDSYLAAMEICDYYEMSDWNTWPEYKSIDGKLYVCKFYNGKTLTRVSSEQMPENGDEAFTEIYHLLSSYTR